MAPSGEVAVSCSTDCSVRLFRLPFAPFATPGPVEDEAAAVLEFQGRNAFRGIDHHWTRNTFGTAGAQVLCMLKRSAAAPLSRHSVAWLCTALTVCVFCLSSSRGPLHACAEGSSGDIHCPTGIPCPL